MKFLRRRRQSRCPLCKDDIPTGTSQRCVDCQVEYHPECLVELGGCATLGCDAPNEPRPASPEASPREAKGTRPPGGPEHNVSQFVQGPRLFVERSRPWWRALWPRLRTTDERNKATFKALILLVVGIVSAIPGGLGYAETSSLGYLALLICAAGAVAYGLVRLCYVSFLTRASLD